MLGVSHLGRLQWPARQAASRALWRTRNLRVFTRYVNMRLSVYAEWTMPHYANRQNASVAAQVPAVEISVSTSFAGALPLSVAVLLAPNAVWSRPT